MSKSHQRKLPWYKRDVDAWDNDTLGMDLELEGFYNRCLNALWRLAGAIPADITKIALLTRCHVRSARRLLPKLVKMGKLVRTADGYANAPMTAEIAAAGKTRKRAADEAPAPDKQLSFDGLVSDERNSMSFREAKNPVVSTRALDQDPDLDSEKEETPLPPERPPPDEVAPEARQKREPVHRSILDLGMGRGGSVSPEARRRVCAKLAIGNADPLVALYETWPQSRAARDPDALFASVAAKLYRDAAPEVRQACQPAGPPNGAPVGPFAGLPMIPVAAQASSALRAKLRGEVRHGR